MTLRGIQNTAHSLSYYARLQEITANNLANVSTDGFKIDRMTAMMPSGTEYPVPVQQIDFRQGAVRDTGRELDVALEGDGFLVVGTDAGERLTRGGSLRLDASSRLVDAEGDPILGRQGPIVIPPGKLEIQGDGAIFVDGAQIDQLRVETVADRSTLLKSGNGRFIPSTPTLPVDENTVIRQGSIEDGNGDAVSGMIDLVTIQRAYSANVDALKAMDGVLAAVANEVGKV